jgi:pimeloyl-ACP methyl ester carboxylesterase
MRACHPAIAHTVRREGVEIAFERYGHGAPSVLLLPTWSLLHSRCWKMQIPFLARHYRVLTFDPRGNGRSGRPTGEEAYGERQFAADALAVLDATDTDRAVIVGFSMGAQRGLLLAAEHPERVSGVVFIAPAVPLGPVVPRESWIGEFTTRRESYDSWQKYNRHYWMSDYEDFVEFFVSQIYNEPHSTKQREDGVGWGLDTDPETLTATQLGPRVEADELRTLAARVTCPVLVIHGTGDAVRPYAAGEAFADLLGGALVLLGGSGHAPLARDPVRVNLLIKQFVDRIAK